uniref:Basic protein 8.2 kDa n=1 Tax=Lymantria dispar multicapsid nuclear polyhedrosis virus TaxID=10449 RepID=A0A1B1MQU6_NPVLD|nr:basic protein 8.2 kDa [Lymantria dispar multiple nucleopolyhedrovirus]
MSCPLRVTTLHDNNIPREMYDRIIAERALQRFLICTERMSESEEEEEEQQEEDQNRNGFFVVEYDDSNNVSIENDEECNKEN